MPKIPWWVWALGLGGVAYLVYKASTKIPQAAAAATNTVSTAIANAWLSLPLVGLPAQMTVLGSVVMPDGTLVPLNSLQSGQIRNDPNGNVLANVNGSIYQLSPSNAQGNYPGTYLGPAPAGS